MRVAFAPWVKGTGEKEKGVEFEVWNGGVRAVVKAAAESQKRNIDAEAVPAMNKYILSSAPEKHGIW